MGVMPNTGGMIALVPRMPDVENLTVDHPEAESGDELHLTLTYLGDDVTEWDSGQRETVLAAARRAAATVGPIEARVMGHAVFNPDGHDDRDPCSVYLVGDSTEITPLREELSALADTEQHEPYLPHITAGFGVPHDAVRHTGPIVFDRLRVVLAEETVNIPLSRESNIEPPGDPNPDDTETKRKAASDAGERRYGAPIGTELGQARDAGPRKRRKPRGPGTSTRCW